MDENILKNTFFYRAGQWCLMALAFLLPVWFLPFTLAPVEFNKALILPILVFLALVFYLLHSVKSAEITMPYHWIFLGVVIIIAAGLASAIMAGFSQSVWGGGGSFTNFFDTLTFLLLSVLIMLFFGEYRDIRKLVLIFGAGLGLLMLAVLIFSIFNVNSFLSGSFQVQSFNFFGSWNSIGFAAGFLLMLIYPFLPLASGKALWISIIFFLLSVFIIIFVNFKAPFLVLACFSLLLLSYTIWRKKGSSMDLMLPLLMLIVFASAFMFSDAIANITNFPAPAEVSVNHSTTLQIIGEALKKNVLFGSGPASFGYLWEEFKPTDVNNTVFWGVRFNTGSSYLLTMLGESGILGGLMLWIFLAYIWYLGLKNATTQDFAGSTDHQGIGFASFLMFSYTVVMLALYSASYGLLALSFISLGFLLSTLRSAGLLNIYSIQLLSEGPKGFVSALVAVFLMISSLGGFYTAGSRYFGQFAFAQGLSAFNVDDNIENAESYFLRALRVDKKNDIYARSLAELHAVRARLYLRDRTTAPETLSSRFKDALDKSILFANSAIQFAPKDSANYRVLGKTYELLVPLNTAGALDAAINQYDEALKHSPKNPLLWRDKASAYLADYSVNKKAESLKKAEAALLSSVELKKDYTEGHFLLAQVYDAEGNINAAIERAEAAALLSQRDIGTLFQLGILYYRTNQLAKAEAVFRQAISINENYSNARYFLGLVYDKLGRKGAAVEQFERIAALNPDNSEVKVILSNLRGGKDALSGIAPPASAPEKRQELPINESSSKPGTKSKTGR